MIRKYNESLEFVTELQQVLNAAYGYQENKVELDEMEFGRRLAVERELEKSEVAATINAGN